MTEQPILDARPPAPLTTPATTTFEERIAAFSCNQLPGNYTFDPELSIDDNYMVLTLIYARLSTSKRGNMACILVDPHGAPPSPVAVTHRALPDNGEDSERPAKRARASTSPTPRSPERFPGYPGRILAHSNNTPEPHTVPVSTTDTGATAEGGSSDSAPARVGKKAKLSAFLARASSFPELHAEARSLCLAARRGIRTENATAYVSFPPCQACLSLLVAAGVTRLVYRQKMAAASAVELCARAGVECVEVLDKDHDEMIKGRVAKWWKEQGEGRDETRTRLERWWKEQEERVMGAGVPVVRDDGDTATSRHPEGSGAKAAAQPAIAMLAPVAAIGAGDGLQAEL